MPSQLPIDSSDAIYRVGVTINDVPYLFDVHWNARDGAWYLDVLDVSEDRIKCGIKVVLGVALGWRCADPRFPTGAILAEDLSGAGKDATYDDLGSRVVLYHYTVEELEAMVNG